MSKDYDGDYTLDAILLWDVMKVEIRANSTKGKTKQSKRTLKAEILTLEHNFENSSSEVEKNEIRKNLEIKKQSLEQLITYKTHGSFIRSRTRW